MDTIRIYERFSGTASARITLNGDAISYVVTAGHVSVNGSMVLSERMGESKLAVWLAARAAFGDAATYCGFLEDSIDWSPNGLAEVFVTKAEAQEAWQAQQDQYELVDDGDSLRRYDSN